MQNGECNNRVCSTENSDVELFSAVVTPFHE